MNIKDELINNIVHAGSEENARKAIDSYTKQVQEEMLQNLKESLLNKNRYMQNYTQQIFTEITQTIRPAYIFKNNKTNSYFFVLKSLGIAYVQDAFDGKWGTQSRNERKEIILIGWDGLNVSKKSLSELENNYDQILAPDNLDISETLTTINKYI